MEFENRKVLFVDDDPNILRALKRDLWGEFNVLTAVGALEGLKVLANESPVEVVVSDMTMPVMNGLIFLRRVQNEYPNCIRVVLTGNADLDIAVKAVNQGQVFKYLQKPSNTENIINVIKESIEKYDQNKAEKQLLESTFQSTINVLIDIMALINPVSFSRTNRIKYFVTKLVNFLKLPNAWQYEVAAMLSQIGSVTVPPEIMEKLYSIEEFTEAESKMLRSIPETGYNLISKIPRMNTIALIIANQMLEYKADEDRIEDITTPEIIGGYILRISYDFDSFLSKCFTHREAYLELERNKNVYHPVLLDLIKKIKPPEMQKKKTMVAIRKLMVGMILENDVKTKHGVLLAKKGQKISSTMKTMFENRLTHDDIPEKIMVSIHKKISMHF